MSGLLGTRLDWAHLHWPLTDRTGTYDWSGFLGLTLSMETGRQARRADSPAFCRNHHASRAHGHPVCRRIRRRGQSSLLWLNSVRSRRSGGLAARPCFKAVIRSSVEGELNAKRDDAVVWFDWLWVDGLLQGSPDSLRRRRRLRAYSRRRWWWLPDRLHGDGRQLLRC